MLRLVSLYSQCCCTGCSAQAERRRANTLFQLPYSLYGELGIEMAAKQDVCMAAIVC